MIGERIKITILQQLNNNHCLAAQTIANKTIYVKGIHEEGEEYTITIVEENDETIIGERLRKEDIFTKKKKKKTVEEEIDDPYSMDD